MAHSRDLDILKIVLAWMVLGMHTQFLGGASNLYGYMAVNGWLRIPVPIFLIINGYFFQRSLVKGKPVTAWLKNVAQLYVVWMVIYAPIYLNAHSFDADHWRETLLTLVFGYWHLWYLSAMLGAAVLLYCLRNLSTQQLFWICLSLFLIGLGIQYTRAYAQLDPKSVWFAIIDSNYTSRNSIFFALPFMGAGFLFARKVAEDASLLDSRLAKGLAWIAVIVGSVLILTESYANYTLIATASIPGPRMDVLLGQLFACPALFWLCFSSKATIETENLAKFSSALYFIHPWLVYLLAKIMPALQNTTLTWALTGLASVAAILLMWLARRLKFLL